MNSLNPLHGHDWQDRLDSIFDLQQKAVQSQAFPSAEIRQDRIARLIDMLLKNEQHICDAMMQDYGFRSAYQCRFAEVVTSIKPLKLAQRQLRKWMKPERRRVDFPFNMVGAKAEVQYQPLGCVGLISPWNFPINLTVSPLAGIFAAGNRAMIKPSEFTPATSSLMENMVASTFDVDELAVINGDAEVGSAFSSLAFDHLLYTGGASVAKHILRSAAENLVPVTLELGGKSPVIVGEGAHLLHVARQTLFGKFFNAGQICLAPDTLFVNSRDLDELLASFQQAGGEMFPTERGHEDYVSIINDKHRDRVKGYVSEARAAGAEVIEIGPDLHGVPDGCHFMPITLVIDPDKNCRIVQEEIFGPVLVIKTYDNLDEVLSQINSGPKPLALYYFGQSKREQTYVINNSCSGGVTVNDVIMHYTQDDLPFGGVGHSGMGAYHGYDGFRQFSHARAVYRQSRFDVSRLLRPPYGPSFKKLSDFLIRLG